MNAAPATVVASLLFISQNSCINRAREPVKTSLDARDSDQSNEHDKNISLHLKFLKKIHICAFALLNFCQNSEKIQKDSTFCASRLTFPIRFFRYVDRRNTQKQDPFKKSRIGPFLWGNGGSKNVG